MTSERMWDEAGLPVLGPEEQAGLHDFWRAYDRRYQAVQEDLLQVALRLPGLAAYVRRLTKEQIAEQGAHSMELFRRAALEGAWAPLLAHQRAQGAAYAAAGISFGEWLDLLARLKATLVPELVRELSAEPDRLAAAILGMSRYLDIAMTVIGEEYLATKEKHIRQQQEVIRELSTPVLRVRDRLLLLPIIGVVDTHRARHLTEQLLRAIRADRAKVVVMDVTGVPAVDSKVANHFLQTVAAARLMGATVVLSGLSAEVAQALVALGVNLGGIDTIGDLQESLALAERLLGVRAPGSGASAAPEQGS